jgi:hypothetical protein
MPKDVQPLLAYVADADIRATTGIRSDNQFLFANTSKYLQVAAK